MADFSRVIKMAILWNTILSWFGWWNVFAAFQSDCDFTYYLQSGQSQVIKNPGYDQGMFYGPGKACRWAYSSPWGTLLRVECSIDMPSSSQCYQDRFIVSVTGRSDFADGENFCSYGSFTRTSISNALTLGLKSAQYSNGGRYRCVITPVLNGNTPPPTPPPTTTTSRPNSCDCGWKQQRRIVGGTETKVNEYAFMAALYAIDKQQLWCGASIISERYAVTAAHCIVQQSLTVFGLLVGDHNYRQANETGSAALYKLEDYLAHESYNPTTHQHDIALVRTDRPIVFSLNVGPICLPFSYTELDFTGAPVTAMGWGTLFFSGPTSDSLQAVNLTVVSRDQCQAGYSNETIFSTEICTYAIDKDSCTYDSGGPVVWYDNFNTYRYQLVGIISYGRDCATSSPGVNTRVPSYISWILNETPDASYCIVDQN